MKNLPPPITRKTFEETIFQWLDVINRKESGSVLNLSNREQLWRINQLLQDKKLLAKFSSTQILVVNLASLSIEEVEDFDSFLSQNRQPKKDRAALFILNADRLIEEKEFILSYLNSLSHRNPAYSLLFFFQKNITLPHYLEKLAPFSTLYQNTFIYPLYQAPDINQFLFYLEKKFAVQLTSKIKRKISHQCGGHLWLIKEAIRYFAKTKDEIKLFDHEEMTLRLKIIFSEFEEVEKQLLEKLVKKNIIFNEEEKNCLDYFLKTRLLTKDDRSYRFSIPLLEKFIKEQLLQKTKIALNESQAITINGIIADGFFSRREKRFLKYLLKSANTIISREKSSSLIWGNDVREKYTDWALDQFVRRLRNKFGQMGLDRYLIVTKKNQGYVFIN